MSRFGYINRTLAYVDLTLLDMSKVIKRWNKLGRSQPVLLGLVME